MEVFLQFFYLLVSIRKFVLELSVFKIIGTFLLGRVVFIHSNFHLLELLSLRVKDPVLFFKFFFKLF